VVNIISSLMGRCLLVHVLDAERIRPGFAALNSIGDRDISPSTQVLVEVAVALLARSD